MILHTVNKSPFSHALLGECLDVIGDSHSLLLLEDGVYAALKSSPLAQRLTDFQTERATAVYALEADLQARGLTGEALLECVQPVGYEDFVRLATEHNSVQSWF